MSLLDFVSLGLPLMAVMALPAGGRLRAYLSREGTALQSLQRCALIQGVASAMSYLESLGIIHRALSLDTVAIGRGPEDPKLVDFGKTGRRSFWRGCIAYGKQGNSIAVAQSSQPDKLRKVTYRCTGRKYNKHTDRLRGDVCGLLRASRYSACKLIIHDLFPTTHSTPASFIR